MLKMKEVKTTAESFDFRKKRLKKILFCSIVLLEELCGVGKWNCAWKEAFLNLQRCQLLENKNRVCSKTCGIFKFKKISKIKIPTGFYPNVNLKSWSEAQRNTDFDRISGSHPKWIYVANIKVACTIAGKDPTPEKKLGREMRSVIILYLTSN